MTRLGKHQLCDALTGQALLYGEGVDGQPITPRLDWIIAGGESGPGARPAHPDWFRSVRDQCAVAGVPFLFKQWGEWWPCPDDGDDYEAHRRRGGRDIFAFKPDLQTVMEFVGKKRAGRLLDGVEHNGFPA